MGLNIFRVCMRCRYPEGFGDHRCVLERIPYELVVNVFGIWEIKLITAVLLKTTD